MVFIIVGVIGLLWLFFWIIIVKVLFSMYLWIIDEECEYILIG